MKPVRVEVPATSANLGPGFDCLGLALELTDTIRAEFDAESDDVRLVEVSGMTVPIDDFDNLLCRAYRAWAADTGSRLPGVRMRLQSSIPVGRGLGSSAAAIVAGLAVAAFASEDKDPNARMLRLATDLEGHADNVAPAVMGGLVTAFRNGNDVLAMHVANHLALGVSLFVPDEPVATSKMRGLLPDTVSLRDASFNLGRLSYLVTALQWGRWPEIGPAMMDRLHQPYRSAVLPGLDPVIEAALQAGAYGAALSGAGPAVIALGALDTADSVAHAMQARAGEHGWSGQSLTTGVRRWGVVARADDAEG